MQKKEKKKEKITIISSDKDLMQLLNEDVKMIDPLKKKEITKENVIEKFGVGPDKVVEVQALAGDTSDNIPGVPGIGPKIASQLINEYGDVENLIKNAQKIKQNKRRDSIISNEDLLLISKQLVTLKDDVKLPLEFEELKFRPLKVDKLITFLEEMEFNRIKSLVTNKFGEIKKEPDLGKDYDDSSQKIESYYIPDRKKVDRTLYSLILEEKDLIDWIEAVKDFGKVSIDCETTSLNAVEAEIVGFSMSLENSRACYIPLNHNCKESLIPLELFKKLIRDILEDHSILKLVRTLNMITLYSKNWVLV